MRKEIFRFDSQHKFVLKFKIPKIVDIPDFGSMTYVLHEIA